MDVIAFGFLIITGYLLYIYLTRNNKYFLKRGIVCERSWPVFGNLGSVFLSKYSLMETIQNMYEEFKTEKIFGFFNYREPVFVICDTDLIRAITSDNFNNFQNHHVSVDSDMDPLLGNGLNSLEGDNWSIMRSALNPAFCEENINGMTWLVKKSSQYLLDYLNNELSQNPNFEFDMKEVFNRCTLNVISSCGFGLDVNTFKNLDNEFIRMSQILTSFARPGMLIKFLGCMIMPSFMKKLGTNILDSDVSEYFKNLIKSTMTDQTNQNGLVHLLNAQLLQNKNGNREWSHDEITAQSIMLFATGFDTVASLLAFTAYELAIADNIQDKLIREIDSIQEFNTNVIQNLKYLDSVISESLRKWPPIPIIERCASNNFEIKLNQSHAVVIEKNKRVWIPTFSLHRDGEHFHDPDQFDPERFNDKNRQKLKPFTYLPFGFGPRNCIGSKFAILQVKILLFEILSRYRFKESSKTQKPLQLSKSALSMDTEVGIWLTLCAREK